MGLALGARLAECKFILAIILCLIADQTQNSAHDVAHYHLPRLRRHQPPSDALHPFDQLA